MQPLRTILMNWENAHDMIRKELIKVVCYICVIHIYIQPKYIGLYIFMIYVQIIEMLSNTYNQNMQTFIYL